MPMQIFKQAWNFVTRAGTTVRRRPTSSKGLDDDAEDAQLVAATVAAGQVKAAKACA